MAVVSLRPATLESGLQNDGTAVMSNLGSRDVNDQLQNVADHRRLRWLAQRFERSNLPRQAMRLGSSSHCFRLRGRSPSDRPSVARSSRTHVAAVRSYLKPGAALSASFSASITR
jgi:hypothetical protein